MAALLLVLKLRPGRSGRGGSGAFGESGASAMAEAPKSEPVFWDARMLLKSVVLPVASVCPCTNSPVCSARFDL